MFLAYDVVEDFSKIQIYFSKFKHTLKLPTNQIPQFISVFALLCFPVFAGDTKLSFTLPAVCVTKSWATVFSWMDALVVAPALLAA